MKTLDRRKYLAAVEKQLERNIFYHSLALEACMGEIYDYLASQNQLDNNDPTKEEWLLAGLIHDIDYFGEYKATHPLKTKEVLEKYGLELPEKIEKIVQAHAPKITKRSPKNKAEWAIFAPIA